jgi:hypothetical protein
MSLVELSCEIDALSIFIRARPRPVLYPTGKRYIAIPMEVDLVRFPLLKIDVEPTAVFSSESSGQGKGARSGKATTERTTGACSVSPPLPRFIAFPVLVRYSTRGRPTLQECQWQGATVKLTRTYSQRLLEGGPSPGVLKIIPQQSGKRYNLKLKADGSLIFYNLLKLLEVVTGTFRIPSLQRIDFD